MPCAAKIVLMCKSRGGEFRSRFFGRDLVRAWLRLQVRTPFGRLRAFRLRHLRRSYIKNDGPSQLFDHFLSVIHLAPFVRCLITYLFAISVVFISPSKSI